MYAALLLAAAVSSGFIVEAPLAQGTRSSSHANDHDPKFSLGDDLRAILDGRSGNLAECELKFAVPDRSPTDSITSALVTLTVLQSQGGSGGVATFAIASVDAGGGPVTLDDFLLPRTLLAGSRIAPAMTITFDVLPYLSSLPPGGIADFIVVSTSTPGAGVFGSATLTANVVPEPNSVLLVGAGIIMSAIYLSRR